MTRYKLPAVLGLAECVFHSAGHDEGNWIVELTDVVPGMRLELPASMLTEVKPPLPEEPPVGAVLLDYSGTAWQRFTVLGGTNWNSTGDDPNVTTWEGLQDEGPLTHLVPDPFAEPVELPWEHKDRDGYSMGVYESQRPWAAARVGCGDHCADLTPDACREMANALVTAADAAEKEQS